MTDSNLEHSNWNKEHSILILILRLTRTVSHVRKRQFYLLLSVALITSIAEVISIGLISPFLAILVNPSEFSSGGKFAFLRNHIHINSEYTFIAVITVAFGVAAIMAGTMRLFLLWSTTRLGFLLGNDISYEIFRRSLYQPYVVHLNRNSGEIIDAVSSKTNNVIYSVIMPTLSLICSAVMLGLIAITLFLVNPFVTLAAFFTFSASYVVVSRLTKGKLQINSELISSEAINVIKTVQEGLGGIRDVLVDSTQEVYCRIYRESDLRLRGAQGSSAFIGGSPRYVMEAFGMVLISALAYNLAGDARGLAATIPVLGVLALGAQRMLPLLQQSYSSWVSIRTGQAALREALKLLEQPMPKEMADYKKMYIQFEDALLLKNISYRYNDNMPWVLREINLKIKKGSRIGIVGATGSGKSTLMDVLMGLLNLEKGSLKVDDIEINSENINGWRKNIAHVPQHIFLSDCSIAENVAFGLQADELDIGRVSDSLRQAQLLDFVESLPLKYWTQVGERGVKLSGGQRQRIGIARALYKRSEVIIFDEATSALDDVTELAIMDSIEKLSRNLTMVVIAHRTSTLRFCDEIYEIKEGSISSCGAYEDFTSRDELR